MIKVYLATLFVWIYFSGVLTSQPVIDGSFEGEGVWGSPIAIGDGLDGWDNANCRKLYYHDDGIYIYLGAEVKASPWMGWTFIINSKQGGGNTDSWARSIDYLHCNLPDYDVRGHFDGYAEFHEWSGSWNATTLSASEFGENITGDDQEGWIETRILKSAIGSPSSIDIQFYITGNMNAHGSFDACPDDDNAVSWDESSNRTPLNVYHTTVLSPTVLVSPVLPSDTEDVTISFNAACTPLEGASKIYLHSGISTSQSDPTAFDRTIGNWGMDDGVGEMTSTGIDTWEIIINGARNYYGATAEEDVFGLNFLFRNADGSLKEDAGGSNYFNVIGTGPFFTISSPDHNPKFVETGSSFTLTGETTTPPITWTLDEIDPVDDTFISNITSQAGGLSITEVINISATTRRKFKITSDFGAGIIKYKTQVAQGYDPVTIAPRPGGMEPGIHYINATTVTLILHAPTYTTYKKGDGAISGTGNTNPKAVVHVVGDFNNWTPTESYKMNRDRDSWDGLIDGDADGDRGDYWWITLTGLTPGQEYVFQYLIDGYLQVADPYCEKVSDPDDQFIATSVYPGLIPYSSKAQDRASIFKTDQSPYSWTAPLFSRPSINDLNIYELHFRDFTEAGTYLAAIDRLDYIKALGINAIHVMPVSEFEGNSSWGYNPNFYFAPDKAYGTKNDLKKFIDECHSREIQVFNDLVLNHSFHSNVMARMWWNEPGDRPLPENPFFNEYHKMIANSGGWWGVDWNHESEHVQKMIDRILDFWLQEYKFDGFRFDFTKGFGQTAQDPGDDWASSFDLDRINLLKRMVDGMWARNPGSIAIFEHLAEAAEDKELADHGILMWSGVGHHNDVKEFVLGWQGYDIFNSGHYQGGSKGFTYANWMSYAESHDEQRLGHEVKSYADIVKTTIDTSEQKRLMIDRLKIAVAFNLLLPGPRMIWQFQELGYDVDIDFNGRTGEKPVRWWYFEDNKRKELFTLVSKLFQVGNDYDLYISPDYGNIDNGAAPLSEPRYMKFDVGGGDHVMVIANLDPRNVHNFNAGFPVPGSWFRYNGDPLIDGTTVTASASFPLDSSEVFLFTTFPVDECKEVSKIIDATVPNTLRTAVDCASDGDTITFDFKVESDTIILINPLVIDKSIVIMADPSQNIVIDGSSVTGDLFTIANGKNVEIIGIEIICSNGVSDTCINVTNESSVKISDVNLKLD